MAVLEHPEQRSSGLDGFVHRRPPRERLAYDRRQPGGLIHTLAVDSPPPTRPTVDTQAQSAIPADAIAQTPPFPQTLEIPDDLPPPEHPDSHQMTETKSTPLMVRLIGPAARKAKKLLLNAKELLGRRDPVFASVVIDEDTALGTRVAHLAWHGRALAWKIAWSGVLVAAVVIGITAYRNYYITQQQLSQVQPFIPDPELIGRYNVVNPIDANVLAAITEKGLSMPSEIPISPADIKAFETEPDYPRVLTIPAIGERTIVRNVSRNDIQAIEGPSNIYEVNWFEETAKPNDLSGALLITGYYSGPSGDGVFHDLESVKIGDQIQLESGAGKTYNFRVVEILYYNLGDTNMSEAVTSADSLKLGLNLMTCDGDYDPATKTYKHRVLVRSVKI